MWSIWIILIQTTMIAFLSYLKHPDFKVHVKQNAKTHKAEMCAEIHSMFDVAWYVFACMIADVAAPADVDYMFSQGSILTCMCCGE